MAVAGMPVVLGTEHAAVVPDKWAVLEPVAYVPADTYRRVVWVRVWGWGGLVFVLMVRMQNGSPPVKHAPTVSVFGGWR
eukprot:11275182-Ditylum_brightwellii.AAC.1